MIMWLKADDEDVMMIKVNRKMNVRIMLLMMVMMIIRVQTDDDGICEGYCC